MVALFFHFINIITVFMAEIAKLAWRLPVTETSQYTKSLATCASQLIGEGKKKVIKKEFNIVNNL